MDSRDTHGASPQRLRDRLARRLTTLRLAVLRRRRVLAALLAAAAVGAAVRATAPPPPPTQALVVAAHDLPAGAVLRADDVTLTSVTPGSRPAGALTDPAAATGATLASPLRAGEPLTDVRMVGPGLGDVADGHVAVPVRLSDGAQAALLTVGDRIDVLATDPEARTSAAVVAGAVVLAVPPLPSATADALTGRLVVLDVPATEVAEVTAAAVTAFVTFAWPNR